MTIEEQNERLEELLKLLTEAIEKTTKRLKK